MKKIASIFVFLFLFLSFFLNLGKLLDVTKPPQKMDIIAVLGGDWSGNRIKKGLELYKKKYSKSGLMIVNRWSQIYVEENGTVYTNDAGYLKGHGVDEKRIIQISGAGKTMYEIRAIKKIMNAKKLHSVIIVTDPPHSRRVSMLADTLENYRKDGINFIIVGAEQKWWDKKHYYKNNIALSYALEETVKLLANYFKYGILERFGLLGFAQKIYEPFGGKLKLFIQSVINKISS